MSDTPARRPRFGRTNPDSIRQAVRRLLLDGYDLKTIYQYLGEHYPRSKSAANPIRTVSYELSMLRKEGQCMFEVPYDKTYVPPVPRPR